MTVRETLQWCEDFLRLSEKERKAVVRQVLQEIQGFSSQGEGHSDTSAGKKLHGELADPALYELVGVSPNCQYFKIEGSPEELRAWWIHPFSVPTLMLKHKRLPLILLVNPYLRFNENFTQDEALQKWQKIHLGQVGHIENDSSGLAG